MKILNHRKISNITWLSELLRNRVFICILDGEGCCCHLRAARTVLRYTPSSDYPQGVRGDECEMQIEGGGAVRRTALEAGVPNVNTDGVEDTFCAPGGVGGTVCSPVLLEEKYSFVPRVIVDGWLAIGGDHVGLNRQGWKREIIRRVRLMLEVE